MGESVKSILQLVLIISLILAVASWFIEHIEVETLLTLRICSALVSGFLIWVLFRHSLKKETLPDHLGQISSRYFERDGFCFAFSIRVINGVCWIHVFYQNRYAGLCRARVVLTPPKSFFLSRAITSGVDTEIVADGASFGVFRAPWPVNAKVQGKILKCQVGCSSSYPNGRGKLMRFRAGLRCGSPGGNVGRAAISLLGAAAGAVVISNPARVTLRMPTGLTETPDSSLQPVSETLWRPDISTGGFPVVPIYASRQR